MLYRMEWWNSAWYVYTAVVLVLILIALGDKSNHLPSLHVPQLYYFVGFTTAFGWPVLLTGPDGIRGLSYKVIRRMFGSRTCVYLLDLAVYIF